MHVEPAPSTLHFHLPAQTAYIQLIQVVFFKPQPAVTDVIGCYNAKLLRSKLYHRRRRTHTPTYIHLVIQTLGIFFSYPKNFSHKLPSLQETRRSGVAYYRTLEADWSNLYAAFRFRFPFPFVISHMADNVCSATLPSAGWIKRKATSRCIL